MNRISDPNQTSVALGAQLFLTHFLTGILSVILYFSLDWPVIYLIITAVFIGFLGLVLNLNIQISLHQLHWILIRLLGLQPNSSIQPSRHGPLMGIMRLVSELIEQERPFASQREQFLKQAIETAAQETRNRLGRDLHDSIKQQLFNINISTAAAQNLLPNQPKKAKAALADVRHSTQGALVEMNALLQQLSPAPLANVGLIEALKEQGQALAYRTGAQVDIRIGELPDEAQFPTGTQEAIFRIAQELLSNVARHARATHVTLNIAKRASRLEMIIEDDGHGFSSTGSVTDASTSSATDASAGSATGALTGSAAAVSQGMGLSNIRNRVSELDGELSITSALNEGTSVMITVPLLQTMTQKEQEMITTDHTLNRFSLIGIGGGVALSVLLFYPFYVYLPGLYVLGWQGGTAVISNLLLVLTIPLVAIIGYLSAKRLPTSTHFQHTVAGGIGAFISFTIFIFLLGGSATIVYGARSMFEQGLVKADSDPAFIFQLIEGITGIIWSWYPAFWIGSLISLLLGSIGGWFAYQPNLQPQQVSEGSRFTLLTSLTTLLMSSGVTVAVSLAIFPRLESQMNEAATEVIEAGFVLTRSTFGVVIWPIVTVLTIYFLGLATAVTLIYTTPQNQPARQQKELLIQAYTTLLVTVALPFFVIPIFEAALWPRLIMSANVLFSLIFVWLIIKIDRTFPAHWPQLSQVGEWLLLGTAVIPFTLLLLNQVELSISFALIGAITGYTLNRRDRQLPPQEKLLVAQTRLAVAFGSTLPSLLAFIIPQLPILILGLGLASSLVRAIPVLAPSQTADPITATELVSSMYRLNIYGLLSYFLFALIIMGIVILVLKLNAVWQARRGQTSIQTS